MSRTCVHPRGCSKPPVALVAYDYASATIWVTDIDGSDPGHAWHLCIDHVERLRPMVGWTVDDRRATASTIFSAQLAG